MNANPHPSARTSLLPTSPLVRVLAVLVIVAASCVILCAAAPEGWMIAGSQPTKYESGIDASILYVGHRSAFLKSKEATGGFGTLMQSFDAKNYLGKRVRFSAAVKTEDVQSWAGLWMRVDKGSQTIEFDNMQNRPLKGTASWKKYDVVLDVPQDSTGIFFGILLDAAGEVWLSDVKFEVVGTEVPTTGIRPTQAKSGPVNLDFEQP
jgi:hypothetical protein